jgi:succinoglycan biosynthesis protein ExoA
MTSQNSPHSSRKAAVSAEPSALPLVSVILPVRNESGFIGRCLQALAAQTYPCDRLEIILVDGQSIDSTLEEARSTAEQFGLDVAIKTNPRRTTATGFNHGLKEALGDVIVRVDGHARVDPDFVSASVRALYECDAEAVGGPIRTEGEGPVGRAIALAMSSPFGIGDAVFRHADAQEQWTDSVPFGAYRREVFDRLGGLAEDIDRGEDDEFNYRLAQSGGRILLTPAIRSTYIARGSYSTLAQQYWRYGLAKAKVLQRHPGRLRPRHLVPSALVLVVFGGAILSLIDRRFGWLALLSGAAYALANGFASLRIASRGHKEELPYLPAAFACIHLPAGAGLLFGLMRRAFRAWTK